MPYTTFLGKTYDNEQDETCTREFGDSYKCLKREYPSLWEFPQKEIQNMCKIFRTEGDTIEDGYEAVKKYLNNHPSYGTKTYTGQAEDNVNRTDWKTNKFQPYPNNSQYPQYRNDEFLHNGDIDFGKVYNRVQREHPVISQRAYDAKWNVPVSEQLKKMYAIKYNYDHYKPLDMHDKFKHAVINCEGSQNGFLNMLAVDAASKSKEVLDQIRGNNTIDQSNQDMYANQIGRHLGSMYPDENCEELLSPYISKKYPYKY